ncbi:MULTISPECIES: prephenate/arogenate dehydrogenase family protein [Rhizobium/Agrobacterium group]|nr:MULTISPECIES: prephenate/arogenate dehydrogenase family protein [unclassified Rhizobium]
MRFPQCLAYDRRLGRGQSRRHRRAHRVYGAGVMGEIMFERIALIGIGLIGSSIARDIKELGLARHVTISTRSEETLKRAEELALGTDYTVSAAEAVKDADLVIVSVPVGASESVAQQIAPHLKPGAIVTDVGSTKASVIAQMAPHMPDNVHFIPGHPLAGTEKSGPDAGFPGLFRERWCIFTPLPGTDAQALEKLKDFWRALGSRVDEMDAEHHDKVLAIVSHLPHIIAYNIVGTADDLETVTESEVIKYSASGFRDFTRLAASDPTMWRDVCLHNKDAILEMLARFSEDLASLQRAIRWGEGDKLFELFSRTRAIRRSIVQAGQDVDAPDFGRHTLDQKK